VKRIAINEQNLEEIQRLAKRIPFFSDVLASNPAQFDKMFELAEIVEAQPGETIINKGDTDMYLYFLLKGRLAVYLTDSPDATHLNYVSPGEVFGVLSMVTHTPRSAKIIADKNARSILLFKMNFAYFNDDSTRSELDLNTKLHFYRMVVNNIRWTLEQNKMADPKHPLVSQLLKLPIPKASKGSAEELVELKDQTRRLSDLLLQWNEFDFGDKTIIKIPGG
jgi:CRP/FNR family transcriptional regulator, cyclic AMP receptor protein